jgi:hypothetical protein
MLVKEEVQKTLNNLGDEFTMDELFERLSFIEHVKAGLKDIEEGRVFSQEELEIEMEKW